MTVSDTMRAEATPTRSTPTAGSAATIVVLLSMATMAAGGAATGALPPEARPVAAEATSVREIAVAVVAAAARDLFGTDRLDTALPAPGVLSIDDLERIGRPLDQIEASTTGVYALDERLLDLPPPAC